MATPWSFLLFLPFTSALVLIPIVTFICVILSTTVTLKRHIAYLGSSTTLLVSIYLVMVFEPQPTGFHFLEHAHFAGIHYCVGIDGLNILFIPLTALLSCLLLLYDSLARPTHYPHFIACVLGYETILMGAFTALNLLQFWFWTALELVPLLLLSLHTGTGQNRRWVLSLLLQYWGSGLLMTLAGFLFLAFGLVGSDHELTFDWQTLKENNAYLHDETLIFILLFFGFSIRMPLFPFHGWLPVLSEQGTVASTGIFLIGIKLGVYAVLRFILPLLPGVAENWAYFVISLGIISLFYGALLALIQINVRRLIAFAALSHSGMLIVGIFSFNEFSLTGSLFLSVFYGLASAGLLIAIGLIYQRTQTSFLPRLGGLFDTNSALGVLFFIAAFSTLIIPGTPSYEAAYLLISGIIDEYGWTIALLLLLGNLFTTAVLLRAFQQLFIATPRRFTASNKHINHCAAHTHKKSIIAAIICIVLLTSGYYNKPWLNLLNHDISALFRSFPIHSSGHSPPLPAIKASQ